MTDGVKFIFKTLLKVPVIIFVSFFVFNILVFFLIYFKMLGFSYIVMQTAVENNYLPNSELESLLAYADRMDAENSYSQANTSIICYFNPNDSNDPTYDHRVKTSVTNNVMGDAATCAAFGDSYGDATKRKQYGKVSRIGVYTEYTVIWPLDYRDTTTTGRVAGFAPDGSGQADTTSFKSESELEQLREDNKVTIPIRIVYSVPGLKYYPDLINY